MPTSTNTRVARFILRDLIGEALYFPLWWYSLGAVTFGRSLVRSWQAMVYRLAIIIQLRNLFRPMYADYSRSGRVISFFFRVMLLLWAGVLLALWTVVELAGLVLWLIGPLFAAALLVRQLIP